MHLSYGSLIGFYNTLIRVIYINMDIAIDISARIYFNIKINVQSQLTTIRNIRIDF